METDLGVPTLKKLGPITPSSKLNGELMPSREAAELVPALDILASDSAGAFELCEELMSNPQTVSVCFDLLMSEADARHKFLASSLLKRIYDRLKTHPEYFACFVAHRQSLLTIVSSHMFLSPTLQSIVHNLLLIDLTADGQMKLDFTEIETTAFTRIDQSKSLLELFHCFQLLDMLTTCHVISSRCCDFRDFCQKYSITASQFIKCESAADPSYLNLYRTIFALYSSLVVVYPQILSDDPGFFQNVLSVLQLSDRSPVHDDCVTQMFAVVSQFVAGLQNLEDLPAVVPVAVQCCLVARSVFVCDIHAAIAAAFLRIVSRLRTEVDPVTLLEIVWINFPLTEATIDNPVEFYEEVFACQSPESGPAICCSLLRFLLGIDTGAVIEGMVVETPNDLEMCFRIWAVVFEWVSLNIESISGELRRRLDGIVAHLIQIQTIDEVSEMGKLFMMAESVVWCSDQAEFMLAQSMEMLEVDDFISHRLASMILSRVSKAGAELPPIALERIFDTATLCSDQISVLNDFACRPDLAEPISGQSGLILLRELSSVVGNAVGTFDLDFQNAFRCLVNLIRYPHSDVPVPQLLEFLHQFFEMREFDCLDLCVQLIQTMIARKIPGYLDVLAIIPAFVPHDDWLLFSQELSNLFEYFLTQDTEAFLKWPFLEQFVQLVVSVLQGEFPQFEDRYFLSHLLCQMIELGFIDVSVQTILWEFAVGHSDAFELMENPIANSAL
jgi:hypothetical protein